MMVPEFTLPLMDSDHPDANILLAFERVRALRAWLYAQRDDKGDEFTQEFEDFFDEKMAVDENIINSTPPVTPSGAAARLSLTGMDMECSLAADRAWAAHGIPAIYAMRDEFDGNSQMVIQCVNALMHMEFEQAHDAWVLSNRVHTSIIKLAGSIDAETDVIRQIENLAGELSDISALNRLVHTVAPDWDCYRRKATICLREEYSDYAAPWLLRDVNYLMGGDQPAQVAA